MTRRRSTRLLAAAMVSAILLTPGVAEACSVCFGDPDSAMAKGLVWGVGLLLAVVVVVLAGIATFFVFISKRAAAMPDGPPGEASGRDTT